MTQEPTTSTISTIRRKHLVRVIRCWLDRAQKKFGESLEIAKAEEALRILEGELTI